MATWVKCTNTKGEIVFANLDNAVTLAQRGLRKETSIHFAGVSETLDVKETPEDLISSSAAGRGMRRTDIG
jgi:hypothetical protein